METREIPILVVPYDPFVGPGSVGATQYQAIQSHEPSAARRSVPFTVVDSAALQTRLDADTLTFTIQIIKADGTSATALGTVVQPDSVNAPGCCFYVAAQNELDVNGETTIVIYGSGGGKIMEPREVPVTVVPYDPYVQPGTYSNAGSTTTAEAIRDRAVTVTAALTPDPVTPKFVPYRNEGDADFETWAVKNPAAALRRFQTRTVGSDRPIEVSNTDVECHYTDLITTVAYPQNARAGKQWALDRDDMMDADRHQIEGAIGLLGGANFAGSYPNATWIEGSVERQSAGAVDFLVIRQTMMFYRAMT
jgi:hypothetical protein